MISPSRAAAKALRIAFASTLSLVCLRAQWGPDTLAIGRVGDGSTILRGDTAPVFLETRTKVGGLIARTLIPPVGTPPQKGFVLSGTSTSEGGLTDSADGRYLVFAGYDAPLGTANVAASTSAAVPRVIARIDLNGNIDTTTTLGAAFSGVSVRGACTEDGTQFWAAGGNSGVVLAPFGGSTGTTISSGAPTDLRCIDIANGQLYATSGNGTTTRCVNTVGIGVPTTVGQTIAPLNGMSSGVASPYDFWFADAQTLYVADDRVPASGGGIQKWTESGGTWTLAYTLVPGPGTVTARGLSGIRDQIGTTLYATTTEATANRLVTVVDTGPSSTFTTLATAGANTVYRGVRYIRFPSSAIAVGSGCTTSVGIPTISTAGGLPISGNANFSLALGNAPPFSLFISVISIGSLLPGGVPLSGLGAPACATLYTPSLDILLGGVTDGSGAGLVPLGLAPPNTSLWGLVLGTQHLVFDPVFYSGFGLPIGNTSGMQLTIGN